MFLNAHECRYLLKLIADNTQGSGYANPDEVLDNGTPEGQQIGKLQAKLSMMREAATDMENRRAARA